MPTAPSVRCDVTDGQQVDQAFKEAESAHGPVTVLVVNAGTAQDRPLVRRRRTGALRAAPTE
ncbi:hypothetical protein GCM10010307_71520 [Streptomyces vastus]|uniref:SDR family NAD(P)-dependent oxidoreductase n=1 Tax=Streptomyces vastus TaxID=285451 RepID=A0ABP6E3R1_9ACTN